MLYSIEGVETFKGSTISKILFESNSLLETEKELDRLENVIYDIYLNNNKEEVIAHSYTNLIINSYYDSP